ncbi:MAG: guanylate kinase [Candidatus Moraniibacteriota bacterium]
MKKRGKVFILVGPTAVGKNTLGAKIEKEIKNFTRMPTATTREKRPGEVNGKDKYFLTNEEFDNLIEKNDFVEWQWVHGNKYGVLKSVIEERINSGLDFYADVEILGALKIKEIYKDDAVLIFVLPPSFEELKSRIDSREAETEKEKGLRLKRSRAEMTYLTEGDCFVLNDELEIAVEDLKKIIDNFQKGGKYDLFRNISVKAKVLLKTPEGFLLKKEDKEKKLPEINIKNSKFPHEAIKEEFAREWKTDLKINKSEETKENKGINLFQPFWVEINAEDKKNCEVVFYYYAFCDDTEKFSSDFCSLSKKELKSVLDEEIGSIFGLPDINLI